MSKLEKPIACVCKRKPEVMDHAQEGFKVWCKCGRSGPFGTPIDCVAVWNTDMHALKVIVRLDKKRKPRHPKYYFIGTRAEADEKIGQLSADVEAMRHDLVSCEGFWCTNIAADGKKLPDGFKLHHKSLEKLKCSTCNGSGSIDSGGVYPWGQSVDAGCPECGGIMTWQETMLASIVQHGEPENPAVELFHFKNGMTAAVDCKGEQVPQVQCVSEHEFGKEAHEAFLEECTRRGWIDKYAKTRRQ